MFTEVLAVLTVPLTRKRCQDLGSLLRPKAIFRRSDRSGGCFSLGAVLGSWNIPSSGATSRFLYQKDLRSRLDLVELFRETRRPRQSAPCCCPIPRVRKDHVLYPKTFLPRTSRFLDMIASSQHMLVVPTLDIDLVWHTHQLSGPRYHKDCRSNVGRYVDQ